ncbi:MAG: GIY-YIG nuclease family protein [Flavobacterium sp.]|uniref:GIY-YIG nuclease family protein n=1 Tax=Flavobacterium sp. TaxID=239 RepID=UPI001204E7E6|nr:GIY-YIG nuclease family protein [Flavobacterium sp.]RZJ66608.1 MAG: GIY-YIG nuclease family protein [Flavobacterium sp.]
MFYYVYILRCKDGKFFTGITKNLKTEIDCLKNGSDRKNYTFNRRPFVLEWYQTFHNLEQALAIKKKLSGWSGQKKKAFLEKNFDHIQTLAECRNATHHKYKP